MANVAGRVGHRHRLGVAVFPCHIPVYSSMAFGLARFRADQVGRNDFKGFKARLYSPKKGSQKIL